MVGVERERERDEEEIVKWELNKSADLLTFLKTLKYNPYLFISFFYLPLRC